MRIPAHEYQPERITIDLRGPGGNAFNLIAVAKKLAMQTGVDFKPIRALLFTLPLGCRRGNERD